MIHQDYTPEVHLGKINSDKHLPLPKPAFKGLSVVLTIFFLKRL